MFLSFPLTVVNEFFFQRWAEKEMDCVSKSCKVLTHLTLPRGHVKLRLLRTRVTLPPPAPPGVNYSINKYIFGMTLIKYMVVCFNFLHFDTKCRIGLILSFCESSHSLFCVVGVLM